MLDNEKINQMIKNTIANGKNKGELERLGYTVYEEHNALSSSEIGSYRVGNPNTKKSLRYCDVYGSIYRKANLEMDFSEYLGEL